MDMELPKVINHAVRTETIYDGVRYGLGEVAIFKIIKHLDERIYIYAKLVDGCVYIATSNYKFKKFDEDHPVIVYGVNSKIMQKQRDILIKVLKVSSEDSIHFTLEYNMVIE